MRAQRRAARRGRLLAQRADLEGGAVSPFPWVVRGADKVELPVGETSGASRLRQRHVGYLLSSFR